MLHAEFKIPVKCIHQTFVACQALKGYGINEVSGVLRHQNMDLHALFYQHAGQAGCLISRDASCHAKKDCLSF